MTGAIRQAIPEAQSGPGPADLLFPEVNFVPDRERLNAVV